MRRRSIIKLCPDLERLEEKKLLSTVPLTTPKANHKIVSIRHNAPPIQLSSTPPALPNTGLTIDRITNPAPGVANLVGPFQQVLVQTVQPIPGQVYNVLSLSMRNSTARTFDASSGFEVKLTGQSTAMPILTGNQQWKPGQFIVFYVLTKKYYPLSPTQTAGFEFNFSNPRFVAIPGPSGIFLRIKYSPATFPKILNWIVVHGPGRKGINWDFPTRRSSSSSPRKPIRLRSRRVSDGVARQSRRPVAKGRRPSLSMSSKIASLSGASSATRLFSLGNVAPRRRLSHAHAFSKFGDSLDLEGSSRISRNLAPRDESINPWNRLRRIGR